MPDPEDDGMAFELHLKKMLEWRAWCDVLSDSKFLFEVESTKRLLFTKESFSKDLDGDFFFFFS